MGDGLEAVLARQVCSGLPLAEAQLAPGPGCSVSALEAKPGGSRDDLRVVMIYHIRSLLLGPLRHMRREMLAIGCGGQLQ